MNNETETVTLLWGSHKSREDGMCAMEWAAYLAGEPHTDEPECVDIVIRTLCIHLNDHIDDTQTRTRILEPIVRASLGTNVSRELTRARAWRCADWAIRTVMPIAFDAVPTLAEHAKALRALPRVDASSWSDVRVYVESTHAAHAAHAAVRAARAAARAADAAARAADAYAYSSVAADATNAAVNAVTSDAAAKLGNEQIAAFILELCAMTSTGEG